MQVSETIGNEAVLFMVSLLCGIGLAFVYDLFRIFRRLFSHGNVWIGIEDACYWIFCTVSVFLLLYRENDGMMRAFCFMGIAFGSIVYVFILSRFVLKVSVKLLGTVLKFIGRILGIIGAPFVKNGKKIINFLRKQLKKLCKVIKMGLCKL